MMCWPDGLKPYPYIKCKLTGSTALSFVTMQNAKPTTATYNNSNTISIIDITGLYNVHKSERTLEKTFCC